VLASKWHQNNPDVAIAECMLKQDLHPLPSRTDGDEEHFGVFGPMRLVACNSEPDPDPDSLIPTLFGPMCWWHVTLNLTLTLTP
jgi:hypothetical protein